MTGALQEKFENHANDSLQNAGPQAANFFHAWRQLAAVLLFLLKSVL